MFKNFDKVFKFTFKNQAGTKSYKIFTAISAVLLIVIPIIISFVIVKTNGKDDDEGIKQCGADKIYFVNETNPDADYSFLRAIDAPGYENITYQTRTSVEDALSEIHDNGETTSLIYEITVNEDSVNSRIIIPENSEIIEDQAENLNEFIDKAGLVFTSISMGVSVTDLNKVNLPVNNNVYDVSGYDSGKDLFQDDAAAMEKSNQEILSVFRMIFVMLNTFVLYMILILYGSGIAQNIVMEKSSKLMDTMLVSVKPEALILGKLLGMLAAAFLQIAIWILSLVLGVVGCVAVLKTFVPNLPISEFMKSLGDLGLFTVPSCIMAVLIVILGIVFYTAIASLAGAVSSNKEEAASNQGIFIMLLLAAFYLVLFGGAMSGKDIPMWQYLVPFTSVMVLPAGVCLSIVPTGIAIIGVLILLLSAVLMVALAGRLYKMMSLYKGNKVNIFKALKMMFSKN
ncbi:MAG: ABC transporter permease [Eubacterium sp.]|nr:ABC transporter permease [Eubacterium sp.]